MSLIKIQINILSDHYSRTFDTWKTNAELYECLERHGNDSFYVFKTLCRFKSSMTDEKNNELICAIPSKKEYHLLDEIDKNHFIKVINQKTIKEPLNSKYDDKILFKVIVYK